MNIDSNPAFIYVYKLPAELSNGYCFGRGQPITFTNVDWFEAATSMTREQVKEFITEKNYYHPAFRFLVLSEHPEFTFTIELPTPQPS